MLHWLFPNRAFPIHSYDDHSSFIDISRANYYICAKHTKINNSPSLGMWSYFTLYDQTCKSCSVHYLIFSSTAGHVLGFKPM